MDSGLGGLFEGGKGIYGCDEWMILLLGPFAGLGTSGFFHLLRDYYLEGNFFCSTGIL